MGVLQVDKRGMYNILTRHLVAREQVQRCRDAAEHDPIRAQCWFIVCLECSAGEEVGER